MEYLSLRHHMEISHRIFVPRTCGVDVGGGVPETYVMSFPRVLKLVVCPVVRCPARDHNPKRLR